MESRDGRMFYGFRGVPFGKVEERLRDSVPADRWNSTIVTNTSVPCLDIGSYGKPLGVEDCLKLDVYTPRLSQNITERLPVLVYIFGGGFISGGSNEYGPEHFLDKDVVLVVLNYRLGALGFLNAGTTRAPGNQGLKDQVLGLPWVQENIEVFSGDRNSVTIFGQSAGGISVSLHFLSPLSTGLFHRAIIQGGSALMPFIQRDLDGPTVAKSLGKAVDCPTSSMDYLVTCLSKLDPLVLGKYSQPVTEYGLDESATNTRPSVETHSDLSNKFLWKDPYEILRDGIYNKVPAMIGFTRCETLGWTYQITKFPSLVRKLNAQWSRVAANMLYLTNTAEDPGRTAQDIAEYFLTDGMANETRMLELEELYSERQFLQAIRLQAELFSRNSQSVYFFVFNQNVTTGETEFGEEYYPAPEEGETKRVPAHGEELRYLFTIHGGLAD